MTQSVPKKLTEIHSWEEVPDFNSESEEADYWADHSLAADFFQSPQFMIIILEEIQLLLERLGDCLEEIQGLGKWEAEKKAADFLRLIRRDIEGILCLANQDVRLLPPALIIARSLLETFSNLMWILNETEENKREIRLVRMINSEIEETKKYIKYLEELKSNPDKVAQLKEDKQSLENYKKEIVKNISNCPQLEKDSNKKKPSFYEITCAINKKDKTEIYPCYNRLSQTVHGGHAAPWIYKESLGNSGTFGEIIEAYHWHTPLYVCYYTLSIAGRKFLQEFAGNPDRFIDGEIQNRLEKALNSLQENR